MGSRIKRGLVLLVLSATVAVVTMGGSRTQPKEAVKKITQREAPPLPRPVIRQSGPPYYQMIAKLGKIQTNRLWLRTVNIRGSDLSIDLSTASRPQFRKWLEQLRNGIDAEEWRVEKQSSSRSQKVLNYQVTASLPPQPANPNQAYLLPRFEVVTLTNKIAKAHDVHILDFGFAAAPRPASTQRFSLTAQGAFGQLALFYAYLERILPGIVIQNVTILPVDEKTVALQLNGTWATNESSVLLSRHLNKSALALSSGFNLHRNPFRVPISYQMERGPDGMKGIYLAYLAQVLQNKGAIVTGKQRLLTVIIRNAHGFRAKVGGENLQVGDRLGQLRVARITPHSVSFQDENGTLILEMSGLNTFKSKL